MRRASCRAIALGWFRVATLLGLILGLLAAGTGTLAAQKKVLGKLGQALEPTAIHASPDRKSRVYYRVQAYEYLVINPSTRPGWLRVLLQNGSHGYILAEHVARLPYDVEGEVRTRAGITASTARGVAAQYSLRYIGTPYKWGGNDIQRGIDCSGFVKVIYGRIGIDLPRTAAQQALVGQPITRFEDLQPGDRLYFWDRRRNKIGHTGIYLGNGFFVHSSSSRRGVATDDLRNPTWRNTLVAARR